MTALTAAQLDELEAYLIQYEKSNNLDPELITGQGTLDGVAYVRASVLRELLALGRRELAERPLQPGDRVRVLAIDGGPTVEHVLGQEGTVVRVGWSGSATCVRFADDDIFLFGTDQLERLP